jgi:hypothetical protein
LTESIEKLPSRFIRTDNRQSTCEPSRSLAVSPSAIRTDTCSMCDPKRLRAMCIRSSIPSRVSSSGTFVRFGNVTFTALPPPVAAASHVHASCYTDGFPN